MEPEQTWAGVEEVIEHPDYDGDVLNDIAVLRLAQEVRKTIIHYNICHKKCPHGALSVKHFHFGTKLICFFSLRSLMKVF